MLLRIKQLKIGTYGIFAFLIIALGVVLRIVLIAWGWPHSNADVDTMGIMAMHIASKGEHPIFFYGQNYMGTLQAYLAVAFFHLFGISVFSLRLGSVLFFTLFLVIMYCLTSLLYTKKLALITLVLLSLGSSIMLYTEIAGIAGYLELLFFGSLLLLLASWLALSYDQYTSPNRRLWRSIAYGCWGLAAGLGFWSDFLMFVFILVSGLLLVLFCWRELLQFAVLPLVLGLIIGSFPLIIYNLHASPGQNTLDVLSSLHYAGSVELAKIQAHNLIPLEPELQGTMLISLPAATGGTPYCYDTNLMLTGYLSFRPVPCAVLQNNLSSVFIALVWSMGFIILWTISIVLIIKNLWKIRIKTSGHLGTQEVHQAVKLQFARLMLLCSGGLILLLFILSPASAVFPDNSRYLVGVLISIPALIAPLWGLSSDKSALTPNASNGDHSHTHSWFTFASFKVALGRGVLLIIGIVWLIGTINTFLEIPTVQTYNKQQDILIHGLLGIKATHIYTDYWTCDSIAFLSREQIICAAVDGQLNVQQHYSRYAPYVPIVEADPNSAYVFPIQAGQVPTIDKRAALSPGHYQRFVFGNYIVYQPVNSH
jgi:4-amino-4-deoxy-L-arabinose transferase-like glycosyltransferase